MLFTVQPIITFAVVKKNNIFWIIVLCYSYIFHDLKRCPYALEMRKQITKLDMNMTWNDKSGCQCLSHLFPLLISIWLKLASIPKKLLSELLSLSHWKIVIFLDIQLQNSLFHSEFVEVLKCNHCPCVNMEQHMYLSLLMYIGQQTDVNFVVR